MRARRTRDEQREDTRRRLLDAARRVFAKRGFHGASLDLVAEEAGFTKGAVYSRFESKADLFLALLDERVTERVAEMEAEAAVQHGPLALGAAIGRQWDARVQKEEAWQLAVIEFRVHAARDPVLKRRYAALHARTRQAIAGLVEREAAELGEPAPATEDLARAALALGIGTVLERAAEGATFPSDLSERMNRALAYGMRAERAPAPAAAPVRLRRQRGAS